ncbi:MAG: LytTR family transcriptional regulator [Saprospiraceae bacterium]|nr:LytTR family transcriptional regulator [Saprospiraceae bacterium]
MKSARMLPLNELVDLRNEVEHLYRQIDDLQALLARTEAGIRIPLDKGVFVNHRESSRFVRINEILMVKAQSNYSVIHLINGETIMTSKTLKHWQEKLNAPQLWRVHQSYLINSKRITSIDRLENRIHLDDGNSVTYSKAGKKLLKNFTV